MNKIIWKNKKEVDFRSVEIDTAYFDSIECKCFVMEIWKGNGKSWIFNSPKEYKLWTGMRLDGVG